MNFNITVTGLKELREGLQQFSDRRFNATLATALTRTAVAARKAALDELKRTIDKPTPYTERQLRYVGASADKLVAAVGYNIEAVQDIRGNVLRYQDVGPGQTPAGKYLQPNITGGQRRLKRLEVALKAAGALPDGWQTVPGQGANLDQYGNISRGQVIQILSQLRIQLVAGTQRSMTTGRSAINAQKRAGGRFFVVPPGGKTAPGVYQREFIGRNITPVVIFVRNTQYRPRYDFDGAVRRSVEQTLNAEVDRAVGEQIQRLASRGGA